MFERFTERAREVVVIASELARQHKHEAIGTDHILLGLAAEKQGLAARVLSRLDFNFKTAEQQVIQAHQADAPTEVVYSAAHIPFTPRGKKALELALREALSLAHNYIGTEHILLGLLRDASTVSTGASPALHLLHSQGIDTDEVRRFTEGMLMGKTYEELEADTPKPLPDEEQPDSPSGDWWHSTEMLTQLLRPIFETKNVLNDRPAPFASGPRMFTVDDIEHIGSTALASMDIVGLPDEFRAGYGKLADAAGHLLTLVENASKRT